jgi:hypothetical protein
LVPGITRIQRTTGSGHFGKKFHNQRIADSGYFKTLKEPPGFMKKPANTQQQFPRWLFDSFTPKEKQRVENRDYI